MVKLYKYLILVLLFSFLSLNVSAKTVNNDFQNWSIIILNKELSDKWGASFEVQNRLGNNLMHEGIFFIRPSLRDRTRLGAKIPMFKLKTWKFVTWDEFFVNLNTLDNGPRGGFDQNWMFTGVEKQISKNTTLEAGYLMNYLNRDPGQLQHALSLNLNINF